MVPCVYGERREINSLDYCAQRVNTQYLAREAKLPLLLSLHMDLIRWFH